MEYRVKLKVVKWNETMLWSMCPDEYNIFFWGFRKGRKGRGDWTQRRILEVIWTDFTIRRQKSSHTLSPRFRWDVEPWKNMMQSAHTCSISISFSCRGCRCSRSLSFWCGLTGCCSIHTLSCQQNDHIFPFNFTTSVWVQLVKVVAQGSKRHWLLFHFGYASVKEVVTWQFHPQWPDRPSSTLWWWWGWVTAFNTLNILSLVRGCTYIRQG